MIQTLSFCTVAIPINSTFWHGRDWQYRLLVRERQSDRTGQTITDRKDGLHPTDESPVGLSCLTEKDVRSSAHSHNLQAARSEMPLRFVLRVPSVIRGAGGCGAR